MDLKGRHALITGSSDGLGFAMGEALARLGCGVFLHGLADAADMKEKCAMLAAAHGVPVHYFKADLRTTEGVDGLVAAASASLNGNGRIEILVNNAVIRHFAPIETFSLAHWQEALAVNVTAALRAIQLLLPDMRSAGWGRIVNMTSVYGARGTANRVDYVTTKTALLGLTRAVAVETLGQGITCNAICPGSVLTPNIDARINDIVREQGVDRETATQKFLVGKQPTGEMIESRHVGDLLGFLCSASAGQITGAMMPIEGGWLAA